MSQVRVPLPRDVPRPLFISRSRRATNWFFGPSRHASPPRPAPRGHQGYEPGCREAAYMGSWTCTRREDPVGSLEKVWPKGTTLSLNPRRVAWTKQRR